MSFLSGTDALIVHLRTCKGGSPDMVLFLTSYFFAAGESFHLGDWFVRLENRVQQWWTFPFVPGSRYLDRDVYLLVSKRTFSAPGGLAAILQHHKRPIVGGERTPGGTHPGEMIKLLANFAVFVPTSWFIYPTGTPTFPAGRPVYPTTRTDTTGEGVRPDIEVPADQALKRAQLDALRRRVDRDPSQGERLEPIIQELER